MSELVDAFRAAEAAVNAERRGWNAMTAAERARLADAAREGRNSLVEAVTVAARALIADAAGRHHVEQQAQVYLVLTAEGWAIDSPTFQGPLEGYDDGPLNSECDHYGGPSTPESQALVVECEALADAATHIDTPTADELIELLQASDE